MTAGDAGYPYYAYAMTPAGVPYVMNGAGIAVLRVQIAKLGVPSNVVPPTIGLPPNAAPAVAAPVIPWPLIIGGAPHTDSSGLVHAAYTWAYLLLTGAEFPTGGTYNTAMAYTYATGSVGPIQSPVVQVYVNPKL